MREIIQEGTNIRLRMNRPSSLKIRELQMICQPSKHSVDGFALSLDLWGLDKITSRVHVLFVFFY